MRDYIKPGPHGAPPEDDDPLDNFKTMLFKQALVCLVVVITVVWLGAQK